MALVGPPVGSIGREPGRHVLALEAQQQMAWCKCLHSATYCSTASHDQGQLVDLHFPECLGDRYLCRQRARLTEAQQ